MKRECSNIRWTGDDQNDGVEGFPEQGLSQIPMFWCINSVGERERNKASRLKGKREGGLRNGHINTNINTLPCLTLL